MTTERIVAVHKAVPFQPFTIRMVDGRSHYIDHPEFFSYRPGSRMAIVNGAQEQVSFLDTMLICEITLGDPPASR